MLDRLRRLFDRKASSKSYFETLIDAGLVDALLTPGGVITRDRAACWSAMHRAISLIAGAGADAVIESISVVDVGTRRSVKGRAADRVLGLLRDSPDGLVPGHTWIEDALTDLLASGNAVVRVDRSAATGRRRLTLCHPNSAQVIPDRSGRPTIQAVLDSAEAGTPTIFPLTEAIIARWPRIAGRSIGGNDRRRFFSVPPIQSIGSAIALAIGSEAFALDFFRDPKTGAGSSKNDMAIVFNDPVINEQTQRELIDGIRSWAAGRAPLVLPGGAKIEKLSPSAQDTDLLNLRSFQISEVGRVYGVPGILLGATDAGNTWGSSVSELAKAFARWGLRLHLNRLLEALSFGLLPSGQRLAVDESRYYRGDAGAVAQLLQAAKPKDQPILTREECRSLVGMAEDFSDDWTAAPPVVEQTDTDRRMQARAAFEDEIADDPDDYKRFTSSVDRIVREGAHR